MTLHPARVYKSVGDTGRQGTTPGFQKKNRHLSTRKILRRAGPPDAFRHAQKVVSPISGLNCQIFFANIVCSAAKLTTELEATDLLKGAILDFFTDHVNGNSLSELYDFIFRK